MLLAWLVLLAAPLRAQDSPTPSRSATPTVVGPDGKPIQPGSRPGEARPAPGQPGQPGQPGEKPAEDAAKDKEKKEEGEASSVRRPTETTEKADPSELEVRPDDDGRIAFNFRNQPWPALLEWLAEISEKPLDWQELPADQVNLASPGRFTIEEARDLFNRHLLVRGYTLLDLRGGLTVVKTEGINPAMVPRIAPHELDQMQPYSFVRTSLDAGWLVAAKLAEEFKPLISGNGHLVALESTNRLEVMDAAVNLRQIAYLLDEEQSALARGNLAREFELRYVPVEEARELLEGFLGIERKKDASGPMSPQQMQQMQQMMQQMQQRAQQGGAAAADDGKKGEVAIVANIRRNSLIINAPPDRMAVAAELIKRIDVPGDSIASLADVRNRVQPFRLVSLDPEKLAELVLEMNVLEPSTRMRVDKENRALIVSGSAADRYIIHSLIERLDGSGRRFEVLQLRRLDAADVAESIAFLMGKEEKEPERPRYYYSYSMSQQQDEKPKDSFRVAANVRFRQVLLWANELEMAEVRNLLVKLGELPSLDGPPRTLRTLDVPLTPESYEYLQRLQQTWSQISPHPLQLPPREAFGRPDRADEKKPGETAGEGEKEGETKKREGVEPRPIELSSDAPLAALAPASSRRPASFERPTGRSSREQWTSMIDNAAADDAADATASERAEEDEPLVADRGRAPAGQPGAEPEGDALLPPDVNSVEEFDRLFRQEATPQAGARASASGTEASPVRIDIGPDGSLYLVSPDTAALDQLEDLFMHVAPPRNSFHVLRPRFASAYWLATKLEDYFDQKEEKKETPRMPYYYYYEFGQDKDDKGPGGLGKPESMKFIVDDDTNTIVVTGAAPSQLRIMEELVDLWDTRGPTDERKMRYTKLVPVNHSNAERIAETVKDAYRDLLSSNDRAFQSGGGGGQQGGGGNRGDQGGQRSRDGDRAGLTDTQGEQNSGSASFTFKGKLSIGVDTVSNTLLVSAEGRPLLDLVCDMIDQLDRAARPQGAVEIFQLHGGFSAGALENAVRAFGGVTSSAASNGNGNGNANGSAAQGRNGTGNRGGQPRGGNQGGAGQGGGGSDGGSQNGGGAAGD